MCGEPLDNVITCMNYKVDKVVFFGYQETIQSQRKNIDNFLCKYCGVQKTVFHQLLRDDLQSILKTMRREIENELKNNNQIYFDITGGESLLLVAFGMLSKEFEAPMHQYDIPGDRLIELDEGAVHSISKDVQPQNVKLNIDSMIEMRGGIINYGLQKSIKNDANEEFDEDVDKIWHVAKKNWDCWNAFSEFIRTHMVPDENLCVNCNADKILKALADSLSKLNSPIKLNKLMDELADAGALLDVKHANGKYRFRFKNDEIKRCLWEGGSILELHTYQKERQQRDDCKVGVHLDWDGVVHTQPGSDVLNEVDVLSLKGYVLTFISCKSGNMSGQQILHALYELQTVADRFGGKYAKKILVTVNPVGDIYMERAQEMDILITN
jgi:hypothetical protein